MPGTTITNREAALKALGLKDSTTRGERKIATWGEIKIAYRSLAGQSNRQLNRDKDLPAVSARLQDVESAYKFLKKINEDALVEEIGKKAGSANIIAKVLTCMTRIEESEDLLEIENDAEKKDAIQKKLVDAKLELKTEFNKLEERIKNILLKIFFTQGNASYLISAFEAWDGSLAALEKSLARLEGDNTWRGGFVITVFYNGDKFNYTDQANIINTLKKVGASFNGVSIEGNFNIIVTKKYHELLNHYKGLSSYEQNDTKNYVSLVKVITEGAYAELSLTENKGRMDNLKAQIKSTGNEDLMATLIRLINEDGQRTDDPKEKVVEILGILKDFKLDKQTGEGKKIKLELSAILSKLTQQSRDEILKQYHAEMSPYVKAAFYGQVLAGIFQSMETIGNVDEDINSLVKSKFAALEIVVDNNVMDKILLDDYILSPDAGSTNKDYISYAAVLLSKDSLDKVDKPILNSVLNNKRLDMKEKLYVISTLIEKGASLVTRGITGHLPYQYFFQVYTPKLDPNIGYYGGEPENPTRDKLVELLVSKTFRYRSSEIRDTLKHDCNKYDKLKRLLEPKQQPSSEPIQPTPPQAQVEPPIVLPGASVTTTTSTSKTSFVVPPQQTPPPNAEVKLPTVSLGASKTNTTSTLRTSVPPQQTPPPEAQVEPPTVSLDASKQKIVVSSEPVSANVKALVDLILPAKQNPQKVGRMQIRAFASNADLVRSKFREALTKAIDNNQNVKEMIDKLDSQDENALKNIADQVLSAVSAITFDDATKNSKGAKFSKNLSKQNGAKFMERLCDFVVMVLSCINDLSTEPFKHWKDSRTTGIIVNTDKFEKFMDNASSKSIEGRSKLDDAIKVIAAQSMGR